MKKSQILSSCLFSVVLLASVVISCHKKTAATELFADKGVTVRLITHSAGIDDKSFNTSAWRGILEFYGDTRVNPKQRGTAYDVIVAQTQDMYVPVIKQAADEGYDLIAAAGAAWDKAIYEAALGSPQQKFLIVDVGWLKLKNIMQIVYTEHEGAYLVGVAAALKAKEDGIVNPRFGFIGGMPGPVITKFEVGYVQGILSVLPNAQIVDYYVNSWGEPALAKAQAKNWYDSGVYAIFTAAGGSGNGTIAQAMEYRAAGKNVWAIGVDSDQYEEGLYNDKDSAVLTSMLKRVNTGLLYALNAVKNNTFKGEVVTLNIESGGVDYSAANPALGRNIIDKIDFVKNQIIEGNVTVAATLAEAKLLPGFPLNLRAIDN